MKTSAETLVEVSRSTMEAGEALAKFYGGDGGARMIADRTWDGWSTVLPPDVRTTSTYPNDIYGILLFYIL